MKIRRYTGIVGNQLQKDLIQTLLKTNNFPNFSIFHGVSGCGKSSLAEITALALTCKNPISVVDEDDSISESEPCLECNVCRENLRALQDNRANDYISKINIALLDRKDIKEQVKYIFKLQPKLGSRCVYILEEFQSLTSDEQTIFLEELSNIPEDIYIIICTTNLYKLIPDIRGRGVQFAIKVPSKQECIKLIQRECAEKEVKPLKKSSCEFLIKNVRNLPREIIKIVNLLIDGKQFNDESLREYLGYMDTDEYVKFFNKCKEGTMSFIQYIEELNTEKDMIAFYRGLQDFLFNLTLYLYGGKKLYFNSTQKQSLALAFSDMDEVRFYKILEYVRETHTYDTDKIGYILLGIRRFFMNQTEKEIIKESPKQAKIEELKSQEIYTKKEETLNIQDTSIKDEDLARILGNDYRRVKAGDMGIK